MPLNSPEINAEGREALSRFRDILQLADPLRQTALALIQPFTQKEPRALREFFVTSAPKVHPKVFPSFYETTLLCAIYGSEIAKETGGELNPLEAKTVGFIHDIGRLVAPHRYGLNDLIGDRMLKRLGVRPEISGQTGPLWRILGKSQPPVRTIEDLTLGQIVNLVSDNLGKFDQNGELWRPQNLLQINSSRRYGASLWPSETRALELLNSGGEGHCNQLVVAGAAFLEEKFDIDLNKVRERVLGEYQRPHNREWLADIYERLQSSS